MFRIAILVLFGVHITIGLLGWDFTVEADGREYLQMAHHLLDLGAFTYDGTNPVVGKPPGFPAMVAAYYWLVGSLQGFQWLQLCFMFIAFVFVSLATSRWIGPLAGVASLALLVAVLPLHHLTHNLFAEAPFLALTSFGIYALVRTLEDKGAWWAVAAGFAFGLSTYMRPINFFWPVAVVLFALVWKRQRLKTIILVSVVQLLVVAPWIGRNWVQFDRIVPMVANWGPLYYMTEPDLWNIYFFEGSGVIRASDDYKKMVGEEFQFNWRPAERFKQAALDNIRQDPLGYLGRCLSQMSFAWTYVPGTKAAYTNARGWFYLGRAFMLIFYAITLLGISRLWRLHRPEAGVPAVYGAYTALILFPVCTESRYIIPVYLWLIPFTLAGIATIWHFMQERRWEGAGTQ